MNDYTWRRTDDIPNGTTFADKFGRMHTLNSPGCITSLGEYVNDYYYDKFDDSREYFEASEDELDDCDVWDAWPFYAVS